MAVTFRRAQVHAENAISTYSDGATAMAWEAVRAMSQHGLVRKCLGILGCGSSLQVGR